MIAWLRRMLGMEAPSVQCERGLFDAFAGDDVVPAARIDGERLAVVGPEPYAAARALVLSLTWRCSIAVAGTVDEVRVGGKRYPVRVDKVANGYRASVPWPLS